MKSIEKYTHYDVEVIRQYATESFLDYLREQAMEFLELPIVEANVIRYIKDGQTKYAILDEPDGEGYYIYTTNSVPVDMSWTKLISDIKNQANGEEPLKLMSKTKVLLCKAEEMVNKMNETETDDKTFSRDMRLMLVHMGVDLDELKNNASDVDENYLNMIVNK